MPTISTKMPMTTAMAVFVMVWLTCEPEGSSSDSGSTCFAWLAPILAAQPRQRRLVAALGCSLFFTHALGSLFGKRGIQDTGCIDFGE